MAQLVQAPTRQPRLGGIKQIVGEFISEERLGITPIAWEDSGCGLPKQTRATCYDEVVPIADKEFEGVDGLTSIAPAFAQYAGVECFIGGDSVGASYTEQARTLLEQGEDRMVEQVLWDWISDAAAQTAASPAEAIAAVEQKADQEYVGRPVIVMSRATADAAFAAGALARENGSLVTPHGNPVLASGSVTDGAVAAIGQPAVYATAIRSAIATNKGSNLTAAIAERVYAIGVDCNYVTLSTVDTP